MSGFEEGVAFTFGFGGGPGGGAASASQQPATTPPPPPAGLGPGGAVAWEVFPPLPAGGDDKDNLIPVDVSGPLLPGPPLRRVVVSSTSASAALAQERGGGDGGGEAVSASDLIPRIYEGGFKAWEGGDALARLLAGDERPGAPVWVADGCSLAAAAKNAVLRPAALTGAAIVELGAGAALPSLVAARRGAASLDVADFNPSVLAAVTAVNVRAAGVACPVRFWAGDWAGLPGAVSGRPFSMVLAAEVGYAPDSLGGLVACVAGLLGGSDSLALLAAKRYYFGVGGGSAALVAAIQAGGGGGGRELEAGIVASTEDEVVGGRGVSSGVVPIDVVAVRRRAEW